MIKITWTNSCALSNYSNLYYTRLKRTANLSDLTDVEEARKNLGVVAASNIGSGAIPDSVVQRDSTGRFKILDAEATNEPVSLNQLNSKQYALTSNNITGTLPISKGGTGATNAAAAYSALGGKALGKLDSIALTDAKITGTLPLTKGGTGATTAAAARTNLGLGTLATQSSIALTSSALTGTLPLSKGGTGATTAAAARTNLGLGALATKDSIQYPGNTLDDVVIPPLPIKGTADCNIFNMGQWAIRRDTCSLSGYKETGALYLPAVYWHNRIVRHATIGHILEQSSSNVSVQNYIRSAFLVGAYSPGTYLSINDIYPRHVLEALVWTT